MEVIPRLHFDTTLAVQNVVSFMLKSIEESSPVEE